MHFFVSKEKPRRPKTKFLMLCGCEQRGQGKLMHNLKECELGGEGKAEIVLYIKVRTN